MAIELKFNRLIVMKESVAAHCTEPVDVVVEHLWQMYLEDRYLMASSSMGFEVQDAAKRLEAIGLVLGRDMTFLDSSATAVDVPWLEVGFIDRTLVCWRSGNDPRPVSRHEFVSADLPTTGLWEEELTKFGILTRPNTSEKGTTVFLCTRGQAKAQLTIKDNALCSEPLPLTRREFCRVDHALLGDIKFALWRMSQDFGR
jgi:hypothetical protein